MKSDVQVKIILGTQNEKSKKLEEFKETHNIIKVFDHGGAMIITWNSGQLSFDDIEEVPDGDVPF
jgi:hypothetical protein